MTNAEMNRQLDYILTCLKNLPFEEEEEEEEAIKSGSSLDLIIVKQTTTHSDLTTEGRDSSADGAHTTR